VTDCFSGSSAFLFLLCIILVSSFSSSQAAIGRRQKQRGDAVDDLVLLDTISEGKIVETLQNRYSMDLIYTNIASVLIAINPFKMIASNYTDAKIREYKGKKHYELSPHVYALADEAYSNMISYRENQCVIISGESGSMKQTRIVGEPKERK
jgi:myosin-1